MAKQYKTWELIKAWQEGERGKFVRSDGIEYILKDIGLKRIFSNEIAWMANSKNVIASFLNATWTKVQEPVDFMTAINSDKRIKPFQYSEYQKPNIWLKNIGYYDNYIEIINGKWLIEEE